MIEWQELVWQCLLQELHEYPDISVTHNGVFIFMTIDGSNQTYMFDMNGYAGETSEEIAKNIAKDMVENYL